MLNSQLSSRFFAPGKFPVKSFSTGSNLSSQFLQLAAWRKAIIERQPGIETVRNGPNRTNFRAHSGFLHCPRQDSNPNLNQVIVSPQGIPKLMCWKQCDFAGFTCRSFAMIVCRMERCFGKNFTATRDMEGQDGSLFSHPAQCNRSEVYPDHDFYRITY